MFSIGTCSEESNYAIPQKVVSLSPHVQTCTAKQAAGFYLKCGHHMILTLIPARLQFTEAKNSIVVVGCGYLII